MNSDQLAGLWSQIEGEAKRKWAKLTEDDWKMVEGDLEKLAGRIQERYGDARESIREQLARLAELVSKSTKSAPGLGRRGSKKE